MKKLNLVVMIALVISGCGHAHGNGQTVDVLPAPLPGYTCFGINNADGTRVGGNCVRN